MSLLFLLLLIALAVLLQVLSRRRGTKGIAYSFHTDRQLVEPDEVFHMETAISSIRRLPVLYLKITEKIPDALQVTLPGKEVRLLRHEGFGLTADAELQQTVWLMPRQKLTRTLEASLPRRGRYVFQSASLSAGDFLGLEEHPETIYRLQEMVVMPAKADLGPLETAFSNYLGELSVRRLILPDPILTAGFREYTGREPMRDISWPRTLRDGHLMVKQYDYTAEPAASVLLNLSDADPDTAEKCFSAARTVCETLEQRRVAYSFRTNADTWGRFGRWSSIPEGLGEQHLNAILDGLGRASARPTESLPALLQSISSGPDPAHGLILITPPLSGESSAALRRFEQRTGFQAFILPVAPESKEASA